MDPGDPIPDAARQPGLRWRIAPVESLAADAWDRIALGRGYPAFMRSHVIVAALAEFGTGREVVATCERDGATVAMGVFIRTRTATWETFQPSQIPLGAFVHDGSLSIEPALWSLIRALPGLAVIVALTQEDPSIDVRPADSAILRSVDYIDTARVNVAGTFDEYWAARGKNLRTNVKRQHAKLAAEGITVHVETIVGVQSVANAIVEYGRLESAGWKAGGGTAVSADNAQGRFYRRVFEACCERGAGRIFRCLFDGVPVATDLCIEEGGVLVVLKTTYDERWKSVSPASLLRHAYFRTVFESGSVRTIEFYGRVMEWHRRWTDDVRTLYHVNVYRSALLRKVHERLAGRRVLGERVAAGPTDHEPPARS